MNVSELNDVQIKAILYDLTREFDRTRQSILALEGELKKRAAAEEPDLEPPIPYEDTSESDEDVSEEEEADASSSED